MTAGNWKQMAGRAVRVPSIAQITKKFGEPPSKWEGRCSELAKCVVDLMPGSRFVYGIWSGTLEGTWKNRAQTRHAWVECEGGLVVDPTRWSFEAVPPYVWAGRRVEGQPWPYDEGANEFRRQVMGDKPCPQYDAACKVSLSAKPLPPAARKHLTDACAPAAAAGDRYSQNQLFWIATLHPELLEPFAKDIYGWLQRGGHGVLIPIDNRRRYLGR